MSQSKPLTKALHTRRVVYRLARHLKSERPGAWVTVYDAASLFTAVRCILDNEPPTDPELCTDCIEACVQAIADLNAEWRREESRGMPVTVISCDGIGTGTLDGDSIKNVELRA